MSLSTERNDRAGVFSYSVAIVHPSLCAVRCTDALLNASHGGGDTGGMSSSSIGDASWTGTASAAPSGDLSLHSASTAAGSTPSLVRLVCPKSSPTELVPLRLVAAVTGAGGSGDASGLDCGGSGGNSCSRCAAAPADSSRSARFCQIAWTVRPLVNSSMHGRRAKCASRSFGTEASSG